MLRILVDSSADLTLDELKEKNIELNPLNITIGETSYRDLIDISANELYELMLDGEEMPKTSQPSPQSYLDIFEDVKEKGDQMLVLTLSSSLSGTYQTANMVKDMVDYDEIYILDTLSATVGVNFLAEHAAKRRDEGADVHTIMSELEEIKPRIVVDVAVDTLEYLCRGGRVSKAAAAVGELASIKPLITVTTAGHVVVTSKAMGRNKAIATIIKTAQDLGIDENFPVYSMYAYSTDNTEKCEEKLEAAGIHCDIRKQLGSTIGAHIGPHVYGIIFVKKN